MTPITRRLRREQTDAEARLWARLRGRQVGGLKFRRQHTATGRAADFACPALRLIVELDGAAHDLPGAGERDAARAAELEAAGWRIMRFRNHQVLEDVDGVVDAIFREAERLRGGWTRGRLLTQLASQIRER